VSIDDRMFAERTCLVRRPELVRGTGGPLLTLTDGVIRYGVGRELGVEGPRDYLEAKLVTNRVAGLISPG
jgi:hypothetical protein